MRPGTAHSPQARLGANIGMLATAAAWASVIPLITYLLPVWDGYFLAFARYGIALPFLLLTLRLREGARLWPAGVPIGKIVLLGGLGLGGFAPLYTVGVAHANPITAAIIGANGPIVAALLSWLLEGRPPDRRMLPGVALVVLGAATATIHLDRPGSPIELRGGEILIVLSQVCWTWYSLTAQRWLAGCSQLRITAVTALPGVAVLGLVWLVAGALGAAALPPAAPRSGLDMALLGWLGLASIFAGVLLWNHGVRVLGIVVASIFLNLCPIGAIAITAALGTPPTRWQLLGAALVLAGVTQAQLGGLLARRRRTEPRAAG
jgi:drug/metabolite transporter (DMT)-like permease